MIESVELHGFRGFKSLSLSGLAKVNIVVGASASGKTALLEGIRLGLSGNPNVAWQLNGNRGLAFGFPAPVSREMFESTWSSLFFDFNVKNAIEFSLKDQLGRSASLKIFFDYDSPLMPNLSLFPNTPNAVVTVFPLVFERVSFSGELTQLRASIVPQSGAINFEAGPELGPGQEYFGANAFPNTFQAATWFSQASAENREASIVEAVSREFHSITGLSVLSPPGQPAQIFATVRNLSKKLPASLVSSGITKFIATITAVQQFHNGVVLIDEIENGIYFGKLGALLSSLYKSALSAGTQLFLTTHSIECLRAAAPIIDQAPADFSLIQVFQKDGESGALVIPGAKAAAAIENDIEVRKV